MLKLKQYYLSLLLKLEFDYKALYSEPNGNFPNHHPDPSDINTLNDIKAELATNKYSLGFAMMVMQIE